MLNCGGTIDLTNYWFADQTNDILSLIIDSHRPISHNNIHNENIVFIDDSKYNLDNVPKEEDFKEVKEADSDEYDSDNDKELVSTKKRNTENDTKIKKSIKNKKEDENSINSKVENKEIDNFDDEEQEYLFGEEEQNRDTNLLIKKEKIKNCKLLCREILWISIYIYYL